MAIYPTSNGHAHQSFPHTLPAEPINIEAWTEQATQTLGAISLAPQASPHGNSVSLAIDIDENPALKQGNHAEDIRSTYRPRREPLRRDSLKRREALLKGKEGSRRRTRWENGS